MSIRRAILSVSFSAACIIGRAGNMPVGCEARVGCRWQGAENPALTTSVSAVMSLSPRHRIEAGIGYSYVGYSYRTEPVPSEEYMVRAGYAYSLTEPSRRVQLIASSAVSLGYESVNRGEGVLGDGARVARTGAFSFGAEAGAGIRLHLSPTVSVVLDVTAQWTPASPTHSLSVLAGTGVTINLN